MKISRRTTAIAIAGATAFALVATGCSSTPSGTDPNEKITLTVATFNDFGYSDELLAEYTELHPNITVKQTKAKTSDDARANYFTKLGAGSGLADVEAVEIDWFAELLQYSDKLTDLSSPEVEGRWLEWKSNAATDADGRLIAYGTDIGPQAICYRADLFAAAGLPSTPDEVAALFDGDWSNYFDVADKYKAATGKPMIDSAHSVFQGMVNQIEFPYDEPDGTVVATDNPELEDAYNQVVERAIPNAAYAAQWSDDWNASMANGEFATVLCPGWMQGIIEGLAPDVTGWNIANTFPNGGGNWGGSYLTIPANGKHVEAAQELADWLSAPEQQVDAFLNVSAFPSQTEAYADTKLTDYSNAYFNGAKTGAIGADRAEAVTVRPYKSADYYKYHDALQNAVNRVFDGTDDATTSWNTYVTEVEAF